MYQIDVSILVSSGLFYPYVCIIICKDANEIHGERASYQPWFGRGLIQITLRANYEKYGEYIGEDVTSGDSARDKLTRLPHSVLSAFWYYDVSRQLGGLAKNDDFNKVTAVINGGFNGYNDRLSIFNSAVKSLGGGHLNKQCTNGAFSFENSSIYQSKIYSLAWGLWHDPFSHRSGTDKNADEALKGYKRAKELLASSPFPTSTPHKKIYGIEYVSVLEYINQRIGGCNEIISLRIGSGYNFLCYFCRKGAVCWMFYIRQN